MNDSADKKKVTVNIYGDEYPITGANDPAYISRIADFVDSRMKETARNSRVSSRDKVAILTAMSIASELYEKKDSAQQFDKQYNSRIEQLITRLETALS